MDEEVEPADWDMYVRKTQNSLRSLAEMTGGLAVVNQTTLLMNETLAITDRSYVIRAGTVLCHGTADEVLNNADAKKYYFGETPVTSAPPIGPSSQDLPPGGRAA